MHTHSIHPIALDARPPQRERTARPAISSSERSALGGLIVAVAGFGAYGFLSGAPTTVSYVFTVLALAALITKARRDTLPPYVALGLSLLAVAHLAGGLIRVGDDVLYNASVGSDAFQYDHFVHAAGVFFGTLTLWTVLLRPVVGSVRRRNLIGICVLAGLGLGAVNEMIEFVTTMVHHGTHVGGYTNTGWDLVSNVVGGFVAGLILDRSPIARGGMTDG